MHESSFSLPFIYPSHIHLSLSFLSALVFRSQQAFLEDSSESIAVLQANIFLLVASLFDFLLCSCNIKCS